MKKKHVNLILVNQVRRRNTVVSYICVIVVIFLLALSLFTVYSKKNQAQYVKYVETGKIDYKVHYKRNNFFENEYLSSNRQYIASLIDSISADFNYRIALDDSNVEYKYSYRIEANMTVKEKNTNNLLYDKKEILLNQKEMLSSTNQVNINENVVIDYAKYNNIIKNFVNIYYLNNSVSTLNINMYVSVVGTCEDFTDNQQKERVISLQIPLTKDTIAIDFVEDIASDSNNVMKCNSSSSGNYIILMLAITLTVVGFILIIMVIRYEIKTRTAETIYEKNLKKILNNYGSNIQMLGSEFDFKNYNLLRIETFYDLLEISDKLRQPILMKQNEEKNGAYFVIPSNTNLLYVYRLKVSDIEKKINNNLNNDFTETDK